MFEIWDLNKILFKSLKRGGLGGGGGGMVKWPPSLLAAPRVCGSNPAQGIFVDCSLF